MTDESAPEEQLYDVLIPPGVPQKLIIEIPKKFKVKVVERSQKLKFANMEGDERELLGQLRLPLKDRGDGHDIEQVEAARLRVGEVDARHLAVEVIEHHLDDLPRGNARLHRVRRREQEALKRSAVRTLKVRMLRSELGSARRHEREQLVAGHTRLRGESLGHLPGGEALGDGHLDRDDRRSGRECLEHEVVRHAGRQIVLPRLQATVESALACLVAEHERAIDNARGSQHVRDLGGGGSLYDDHVDRLTGRNLHFGVVQQVAAHRDTRDSDQRDDDQQRKHDSAPDAPAS